MGNTLNGLTTFIEGLIETLISRAEDELEHENLNQDNIQGDIILGLPKKVQAYVFYRIKNADRFRKELHDLVPMITTMQQVTNDSDQIQASKRDSAEAGVDPPLLPLSGTNIAFSYAGLEKLKITDLKDDLFKAGQKSQFKDLGDPADPKKPSEPDWIPEFRGKIDLVITTTGASPEHLNGRLERIKAIFKVGTKEASLEQVLELNGKVRPGKEKGHEHFGYKDGISQPGVNHFTNLHPGQEGVPAGIALCSNVGDALAFTRPKWSKDGSFLVFRYFEQLVPEFDDFCKKHPIASAGAGGAELAGARMFGRWKSGAPLDLAPTKDDPVLANDPDRNNNFSFADSGQGRCPFAAHVRKANPRGDLKNLGGTLIHRIWRQGIPFGPEVTAEERQQSKTLHSRGLLFVCYQSNIKEGFSFVQQSWSNTVTFPPKGCFLWPTKSGFDPIIGINGNNVRDMYDPEQAGKDMKLAINYVVPKGGEYFFSPSIEALGNHIAVK